MNKILKYIMFTSLSIAFFACDKDEYTGDSKLTPGSPTATVSVPTPAISLVEKDSVFEFTVTLNSPQIVDVSVYLKMIEGDATEGDDFGMDEVVTIPAGKTSATATIEIHEDDVPEATETFKIQIGDERTANAAITPATVEFTILNLSEGDLAVGMSWASDFHDESGEAVAPTAVADLILLITDEDGNVVDVADGGSFEETVIPGDAPDGTYFVVAGVYDAVNSGIGEETPVLDLTLEYSQLGVASPASLEFPASFVPTACDWNLYTLASITKTGTTYTVERVGELVEGFNIANFEGDYEVVAPDSTYSDSFTAKDCYVLTNENFWYKGISLDYALDPSDSSVTVAPQLNGDTLLIQGWGTFDPSTLNMVMAFTVKEIDDTNITVEMDSVMHTFTKE